MATPKGRMIFVDIDTQRDFLEPRGSVYLEGSAAILPNLARLTTFARDRDVPVLATACWHDPEEPNPEPEFPPHCLVDSKGAERINETRWPGSLVLPPDGEFDPPREGMMPAHLTLQKRRFDLFTHPEADKVVAFYAEGEPTFVVYGIATDVCVAEAVRGLLGRNHKVALVTDAIHAVDADKAAALLEELRGLGATETTTDEVVGEA